METLPIEGKEIFPGIIIIDNAIRETKKVIEMCVSDSDGWKSAEIFVSGTNKTQVDKEYRNTDTYSVDNSKKFWYDLCQIIFNYADQYAKIYNFPFSEMESPQILFYQKGFGKYESHIDTCKDAPRIMSALLYLNDVEEGGETYFDLIDVSVTPKAGRLVLFPSNYVYSHAAKIPISNEKFALVTWFKP